MISNINYRGQLADGELQKIKFEMKLAPPYQKIYNFNSGGKMLIFPSGKCRLMGLQSPLEDFNVLPFAVKTLEIQSITLVLRLPTQVNLIKLAKGLVRGTFWYEPELFPALRLQNFNPLCVNVFSSGKVILMGVKDFDYGQLVQRVLDTINEALQFSSDM